jgi:hypothetical protein
MVVLVVQVLKDPHGFLVVEEGTNQERNEGRQAVGFQRNRKTVAETSEIPPKMPKPRVVVVSVSVRKAETKTDHFKLTSNEPFVLDETLLSNSKVVTPGIRSNVKAILVPLHRN